MHWLLVQLALLAFVPYFSRRWHRLGYLPKWLSPVVFCYATGIVIRNIPLFPVNEQLANAAIEGGIILAIPLLLYATDLKRWLALAGSSLLSFGLCVGSGLAATITAAYVFQGQLPDTWRLAGMLVGIYTGGTPNMQAVGLALEASKETIILVNAADVLLGGLYLLLLTSFLPGWFARLLPRFDQLATGPEAATENPYTDFNYRDAAIAIGYTLLVVGAALGLTWLVFGSLSQIAFLMLMLTTISLAASLLPAVRQLEHTFETGEYFLLIFCVALGMMADFGDMMEGGLAIIQFTGFALAGTVILHLLLAYLFGIDRDTFLFTSVAAVYGPPFIGQIASITQNRQLILSGIAMGLLGYAIGNYIGIGLGYLLQWAIGS